MTSITIIIIIIITTIIIEMPRVKLPVHVSWLTRNIYT